MADPMGQQAATSAGASPGEGIAAVAKALANAPPIVRVPVPKPAPKPPPKVAKPAGSTNPRLKTPEQIEALENHFKMDKFPTEAARQGLGQRTGLTEKQVNIWFTHRRKKEKREEARAAAAAVISARAAAAAAPGGIVAAVAASGDPAAVYTPAKSADPKTAGSATPLESPAPIPAAHPIPTSALVSSGPVATAAVVVAAPVVVPPAAALPPAPAAVPIPAPPVVSAPAPFLPPPAAPAPPFAPAAPHAAPAPAPPAAAPLVGEKRPREGVDDDELTDEEDGTADVRATNEALAILGRAKAEIIAAGITYLENGPQLGHEFDPLPESAMKRKVAKVKADKVMLDGCYLEGESMDEMTLLRTKGGVHRPEGWKERMELDKTRRANERDEDRLRRIAEAEELRRMRDDARADALKRKLELEIAKEEDRKRKALEREEERRRREEAKEEERKQRELLREQARLERVAKKEQELIEKEKLKEENRIRREAEMEKRRQEKLLVKLRAREASRDMPDDEDIELVAISERRRAEGYGSDTEGTGAKGGGVARPAFPPPAILQPCLPEDMVGPEGGEAGDLLMVWRFLADFSDVLGVWPCTVDELAGAVREGEGSRLLGELHIALMRLIQADVEEAHVTGLAPASQNEDGTGVLEEAWSWGFDVDTWRAHLNAITWPEIVRQFALAAGLGRRRPLPPVREAEDSLDDLDDLADDGNDTYEPKMPSKFLEGSVKGAAWTVLSVCGPEGLGIPEIAKRIQSEGHRDLRTSKTPEATVAGALSRDTAFLRVAPSTYALQSVVTRHRRQVAKKRKAEKEAAEAAELAALAPAYHAPKDGGGGDVKMEDAGAGAVKEEEEGGGPGAMDVDEVTPTKGADPAKASPAGAVTTPGAPASAVKSEAGTISAVKSEAGGGGAEAATPGTAAKSEGTPGGGGGGTPSPGAKGDGDSDGDSDEDEDEDDEWEDRPGEAWCRALERGEYDALAHPDRIRILTMLADQAMHCNAVRVKLEERIEAAANLRRRMWQEAQDDKRDNKIRIAEVKLREVNAQMAARPAEGAPLMGPEAEQEAAIKQAEAAAMAVEAANERREIEAEERRRKDARADAVRRGEAQFAVRAEPLGLDRRYNRYWRFVGPEGEAGGGPDKGLGRLYIESAADGSWSCLTSERQLDSLMGMLDPRGRRESELHAALSKAAKAIRQGMRASNPEEAATAERRDRERAARAAREREEKARKERELAAQLAAQEAQGEVRDTTLDRAAAEAAAVRAPSARPEEAAEGLEAEMPTAPAIAGGDGGDPEAAARRREESELWLWSVQTNAAAEIDNEESAEEDYLPDDPPRMKKLKRDLAELEAAIPLDAVDESRWRGRPEWLATVKGSRTVEGLRGCLEELESIVDAGWLHPAFQRECPGVLGLLLDLDAAAAAAAAEEAEAQGEGGPAAGGGGGEEAAGGAQGGGAGGAAAGGAVAMDEDDDDGEGAGGHKQSPLAWVCPTTAALSLRVLALDAAIRYRAGGEPARDSMDSYKFIVPPVPQLPREDAMPLEESRRRGVARARGGAFAGAHRGPGPGPGKVGVTGRRGGGTGVIPSAAPKPAAKKGRKSGAGLAGPNAAEAKAAREAAKLEARSNYAAAVASAARSGGSFAPRPSGPAASAGGGGGGGGGGAGAGAGGGGADSDDDEGVVISDDEDELGLVGYDDDDGGDYKP